MEKITMSDLIKKQPLITRMMGCIWLMTASGLWATAGFAWILDYYNITATHQYTAPFFLATVLLLGFGFRLRAKVEEINTLAICVIYFSIISLFAIISASLFPVTFVTLLFGICGTMFLISTLLALCFNINMASHWYALLLICVGWGISFVTNFTLLNSLYLWLISFCFVLLWSFIVLRKINVLKLYVRNLYSAAPWTLKHCVVAGALMLYFDFVCFFWSIVMMIFELLNIRRWLQRL
ncbi:hypothetical protein NHH33_12705 [Escherichia albertii]|uniref:hypothetical protein n=1 Tax=Escherichia albertii TaxID=208962 RepID=UPI00211A19E6|nr:hypothetical protein [Escherichia albertii]MCQ8930559.1 hypothetical protein [Escherichia albertii]MCQ8965760.1 hypothetical protein [Escherichia albertii]UUK96608.1 hypothetical protein NIZ19_23340 [Escherichia albertii]